MIRYLFGGAKDLEYFYITTTTAGNFYNSGLGVDSENNIYVGSSSISGSNSYPVVSKFNSNGSLSWRRTILTNTAVIPASNIVVGPDGNVYCVSSLGGNHTVVKIDSSGTFVFARSFNANEDFPLGITLDPAGNIYMYGYADNTTSGANYYATIVKFNSSGVYQWHKFLNSAGTDAFTGVSFDSSLNVYAVGQYNQTTESDGLIVKFDTNGNILFQKNYFSGTASQVFIDGKVETNNLYVCGYTQANSTAGKDAYIAKLDLNGNYVWQKTLTSNFGIQFNLLYLNSGDIYVAGEYNNEILLLKYDNNGNILWQRRLYNSSASAGTESVNFIEINNNRLLIAASFGYSFDTRRGGLVFSLPIDGSKTGTYTTASYGNFVYTTLSLTGADVTLSVGTTSLTVLTNAFSDSSPTYTLNSTATYTDTVTLIP